MGWDFINIYFYLIHNLFSDQVKSMMNESFRMEVDETDVREQRKTVQVLIVDNSQSSALTIIKLFALVILTFALIVVIWLISTAIQSMDGSLVNSYVNAGGLLFGLFCFYVLCFGGAWYWGSGQRQQIRTRVVQQQIARQRALQAMNNLE